MQRARWYPTAVTLGDERRVLVVGGAPSNDTVEVYDELSDSFALVTGPGSTRAFPQLYPGLHLLPGGEVFYSRTGFGSAGAGPGGAGDPLNTAAYFRYIAPASGSWTEIADVMEYPDRVRGMSVILVDHHGCASAMVVGGTSAPGSSTAQIIGLHTLNPVWHMPMEVPPGVARNNVNAVLLPDGNVFVCGGTTDPNVACALYRPATGTWTQMAHLNYRKQYHSVAVLLPSGRVVATGGSNYGGGSNVIEIFSPPYLFQLDGSPAPRPVIDSAPALVHHGHTFNLVTSDAADVRTVVFVKPMAVTHQTDSEQRVVEARFVRRGNTLRVTAPDGQGGGGHVHGMAPRGYYMLFILKERGVPSEGRFIFLH